MYSQNPGYDGTTQQMPRLDEAQERLVRYHRARSPWQPPWFVLCFVWAALWLTSITVLGLDIGILIWLLGQIR